MISGEAAPDGTSLAARTWGDIPHRPLVLVPTGSTEQHGRHLPLDTDSVIASAVATAVARRLGATRPHPNGHDQCSVLVAPTVEFGASGEHEGFPGTVSIGHTALSALLIELVRSLSNWAGPIVVINGHGGNLPTVADVVVRMTAEGHDVRWVPCAVRGGDAHAGRVETSLMLHLAPHRVNLALASAGNTTPIGELMPRLLAGGVRSVSESGVLGDPAGATAAEGATLLAAMVDDVCRRIRDEADSAAENVPPLSPNGDS